ncbi:MAG: carboxypeptidase M32 [Sphingobacteriales bacterium JAD_PAG50586_3]|nr:MAG: carboxypeptidase M32 [Sphingobacteriales bacterium JAD_PAG50586_3]
MSYENYTNHLRKLADVNYANALLQWDQEVFMPEKGAAARASQQATLSGIAHELATAPVLGGFIKELLADNTLTALQRSNVERTAKEFEKRNKFSTQFVEEMSMAISAGFQAWQVAKKDNNYAIFEPKLQKLIDLKRREVDLAGYDEHPYDALLDDYEPGTTAADVKELFDNFKPGLKTLLDKIFAAEKPDDSFFKQHFNKDTQWDFGIDLLKQMGYDFSAGRQDISAHPFTVSFGSGDVRVTTRVSESDLTEMIWSCIHEGGHALYEQGLPEGDYGLPSGEAVSLAIHESQSRLWENNVGRSRGFWEFNYPMLQSRFGHQLGNVPLDAFYKAFNRVEPSLIRTSADELTYHFHIIIRFELELAMVEGTLSAKDLPEAWNAKYKEYLGIDVPNYSQGVLQDVHWSHGSMGYFSTYSLGSLYAAQFYAQAVSEVPGLESSIATGQTAPLLNWLRDKIHNKGRNLTSRQVCEMVTGKPLDAKYFMDYANKKYGNIYGF